MRQQLRSRKIGCPLVTAVAIAWLGSPANCRGNDAKPTHQSNTHMVGDGDVLNVTVPTLFDGPIAITDDGLLHLARCEPIPVRGLNLEQAQQAALQELRELNPALDVEVTLSVPRRIRVSVIEITEGVPSFSAVRLAPTEQYLPSALQKAAVAVPEGHNWRLRLYRLNGEDKGTTICRLEKLLSAEAPVDTAFLDSLVNSDDRGRASDLGGVKHKDAEEQSLKPLREGDILVAVFQQPSDATKRP